MVQIDGTGQIITNFAYRHLKAAKTFRDQVCAIETQHNGQSIGPFYEDICSYASACIMSSVASLEALINEFFMSPNYELRSRFNDFESEFWGKKGIEKKPILEKYQCALDMLNKPLLDMNSASYQNAWTLIDLRNALVHYKPLWDPNRQKKVDLVERLRNKYSTSPFIDDGSDFLVMKSMSSDCTLWVFNTVITFMQEFDNQANLDPHKMAQFWKLKSD